jgi:hypothetical protein
MPSDTVTFRGATTLSGAGNLFAVFATFWIIVGLFLADFVVTLFVPRASRPQWLSWLMVATAFVPAAIALLAGPLGRRYRQFRWLLGWPQPQVSVDDLGLELCLPRRGCQRFGWNEIARLVPATLTLRQRWTTRYPGFGLLAPDGRVLATLPYFLALPGNARPRGTRHTLAEGIVSRRPDRYALLRPVGLLTAFLTFGLVGEAPPSWEIDAAARRRRTLTWLVIGTVFVLSVLTWMVIAGVPR